MTLCTVFLLMYHKRSSFWGKLRHMPKVGRKYCKIGLIIDSHCSHVRLIAGSGYTRVHQIVEQSANHTSDFESIPVCMASAHGIAALLSFSN